MRSLAIVGLRLWRMKEREVRGDVHTFLCCARNAIDGSRKLNAKFESWYRNLRSSGDYIFKFENCNHQSHCVRSIGMYELPLLIPASFTLLSISILVISSHSSPLRVITMAPTFLFFSGGTALKCNRVNLQAVYWFSICSSHFWQWEDLPPSLWMWLVGLLSVVSFILSASVKNNSNHNVLIH